MAKEALIRKKAIQILEEGGWVVWCPSKVRFKQNDVFGIIDVLALRKKEKKNIQLTTLTNLSTRRKKILNFCQTFNVQLAVEIWAWDTKGRKFKKEIVKHHLTS